MKYKVEMFYTLNEDTTFRYDMNCKTFIEYVANGVIIVADTYLVQVKLQILSLLIEYSEYTSIPAILPASFDVRVSELLGVNNLISAIIPNTQVPSDLILVYQGPLVDML